MAGGSCATRCPKTMSDEKMKELMICEFPWQVDLIEQSLNANTIVMALNPSSAYALEKRGIPFSDARSYYSHQDLWAQYPVHTRRTIQLTDRLDEIVWQVDSRFRENGLRCFDSLFYTVKIAVDQVVYLLHVFSRLLSTHAIGKVACLELRGPYWDDLVLYKGNFSLASFVLTLLADQHKFQLEYVPYPAGHCPDSRTIRSSFSFGQPTIRGLLRYGVTLRDKLVGIRDWWGRPRANLLSVTCRELEALRDPLRKSGVRVSTYRDGVTYTAREHDYPCADEIMAIMARDTTVRSLLAHDGVDLFPLISKTIRRLLNNFERLFAVFRDVTATFAGNRIDAVFLASLTPFHMPNIFVAHLCKARNIPCYCWMHGGYGAYYSLPGYDVVDFRLGKRHCVYGQANRDLLESNRCVTRQLGFTNQDVHVTGSPFLEQRYGNYVRPDNVKKKILFTIGNYYVHNAFYFGYNRPYAEFCNWDEHKAIIRALAKHQNEYDIVIKDYPASPMRSTWESLLADVGGNRVKVITDGTRYQDVLTSSDLHIFSWISTTFMESLLTDADMFLLDTSDITVEADACLRESIGFSSDTDEFIARLDAYLTAGKFYTQTKDRLRVYFMDYGNRGRRHEVVSDLVFEGVCAA